MVSEPRWLVNHGNRAAALIQAVMNFSVYVACNKILLRNPPVLELSSPVYCMSNMQAGKGLSSVKFALQHLLR